MNYKAQIQNGVIVGYSAAGTGAGFFDIDNRTGAALCFDADYVYDVSNTTVILYSRIESAIKNIADNWQTLYKDYKQARRAIADIIAAKGFENLSSEEKKTAAEWFVIPVAYIDQVLTLPEKLSAAQVFNLKSIESRIARFETVKTFVYNVLSYPDAVKIMSVMLQRGFEQLYTRNGQEGTMSVNYNGLPDQAGLFDFILSTPGTEFEFTGVASLGLSPNYGYTVADVITVAMDILQHGNYSSAT